MLEVAGIIISILLTLYLGIEFLFRWWDRKEPINNNHLKNMKMSEFFKKISDVCNNCAIDMTIMKKDGRLTISFLPRTVVPDAEGLELKPLLITAEPEKLDESFFNEIIESLKKADQEYHNSNVFDKQLKEAADKKREKASGKKKTTETTKKKEEKQEEHKSMDMFSQDENKEPEEKETPPPVEEPKKEEIVQETAPEPVQEDNNNDEPELF